VVALVDSEVVTAVAEQTVEQYEAGVGKTADAFICRPGQGAGLVAKMEVGD
jgi:galactokinase